MLTDLDSDAARPEADHHPVASPAGAFPALSDRLLVELHMHHDVCRVINLHRLQYTVRSLLTPRCNSLQLLVIYSSLFTITGSTITKKRKEK